MDDTNTLIDKLTKAVAFVYKGSSCAPGLVISLLPNKQYYVSIAKYGKSHKDKTIMHSAKAATLSDALVDVTHQLLESPKSERNPLDELRDHVELGS